MIVPMNPLLRSADTILRIVSGWLLRSKAASPASEDEKNIPLKSLIGSMESFTFSGGIRSGLGMCGV